MSPAGRESLMAPRGFDAVTSSFSPDGKTLAIVVTERSRRSGPVRPTYLSFWDWQTRTERGSQIPLANPFERLIWRKGGRELLITGDKARLVEVATGKVTSLPEDVSRATSPDGTRMIRPGKGENAFDPTSFSVVDVDSRKILAQLKLPESFPKDRGSLFTRRWSFSPDNAYVTLTVPPGEKGILICWKVGQETPLWVESRSFGAQAATFDPAGRSLYCITMDRSLSATGALLDTQHVTCLETVSGKKQWATMAMLIWDEDILANEESVFLNTSNGVRTLDAKTGTDRASLLDEVVDTHGFHDTPKIALSPDGKTLAERHEFGIRLRRVPDEGT